jgi:hypothetical protein
VVSLNGKYGAKGKEILGQMFSGALMKDLCPVLYPQPNQKKERTIKNKNEVTE